MEKDALQAIYERFYRPLFLYALSLCRNRDDAEDLVQSTFLKAFLSYEEGGSIQYWLTKVLQNEFYNLYRRRKKLVPEGDFPLEQIPDPRQEAALLEQLIAQEQKRYLFQAVMDLNLTAKEVMLGSIYFDLSDEEIGRQLGLTRENVRKIRSRARQQLAQKMEERYGR